MLNVENCRFDERVFILYIINFKSNLKVGRGNTKKKHEIGKRLVFEDDN